MKNVDILKKCGWSNKELEFDGVYIISVENDQGDTITELVSRQEDNTISVEWFAPDSNGEVMSFVMSNGELVESTDDINDINDVENMINAISSILLNIKNKDVTFMPTKKNPFFQPEDKLKM